MIVCGKGVPVATVVTAANTADVTQMTGLVDRVPASGRHPRFQPKAVLADRAYDSRPHRRELRARGIKPLIPKRGTTEEPAVHGSGLGTQRWVVERTISWLHQNRRLDRRYEKRTDVHQAFLTLGRALVCEGYLKRHQNSFC